MNASPAAEAPTPRHFICRDNLRLHYLDLGPRAGETTATSVLCLPGLTRNGSDFVPLARRLAPTRRVLVLDGRGRGRSDYALGLSHYRAETDLDDILQFLVAVGVHRVVAIGTSFGGAMVQALAAVRPTVLAGAVLNDIGPTVGWEAVGHLLDAFSGGRTLADWDEAVGELKWLVPELGLRDDDQWLEAAKGTWRESADGKLRVDFDLRLVRAWRRRGVGSHDLWSLWRALGPIPALLVRGEISRVLTAETTARMRESKPDLETVEVPGVGHAPSLIEPEVSAAIDGFLADVDRREQP
jgi:pimeloyl-ACP methyl ester carboxylesterase